MNTETTDKAGDIPEEAENLLNSMDVGEEAGAGNTQDGPEAEPGITPEIAKMQAIALIDMSTGFLSGLHPAMKDKFPVPVKQKLLNVTTPLVIKYDGDLPEWMQRIFEKWQEEISFGFVVAGIAYGSVKAVKEFNREEKKKAQEKKQDDDQ